MASHWQKGKQGKHLVRCFTLLATVAAAAARAQYGWTDGGWSCRELTSSLDSCESIIVDQ